MRTQNHPPPHLPKEEGLESLYWVGTRDPYAPQYTITRGPSRKQMYEAFLAGQAVEVEIQFRTGDMDDDEELDPAELIEIEIMDMYPRTDGTITFVASGAVLYCEWSSRIIFVWEYDSQGEGVRAGLDFSPG